MGSSGDDRPFTTKMLDDRPRSLEFGLPGLECCDTIRVLYVCIPVSITLSTCSIGSKLAMSLHRWCLRPDERALMPTSGPPSVAPLDSSWPLGRPSSPLSRLWANPTTPHARLIETPTRLDMVLACDTPSPGCLSSKSVRIGRAEKIF